jgi:hypothetical protein
VFLNLPFDNATGKHNMYQLARRFAAYAHACTVLRESVIDVKNVADVAWNCQFRI